MQLSVGRTTLRGCGLPGLTIAGFCRSRSLRRGLTTLIGWRMRWGWGGSECKPELSRSPFQVVPHAKILRLTSNKATGIVDFHLARAEHFGHLSETRGL